jgi:hypothetical protein
MIFIIKGGEIKILSLDKTIGRTSVSHIIFIRGNPTNNRLTSTTIS